MSELLRINLPAFEGPLDLLLYLIRRDAMDIWDIPISRITDEFLQYVQSIQEVDLDSAGDFVVMAATLTQIKSRMLLPTLIQGDDDDEEDPRLALVERLLEYERFRKAAQDLEQGTLLGRDVFEGGQSATDHMNLHRPPPDAELWDLVSALKEALDRAKLRGHVHHIDIERFSVVDRIHVLHDLLTGTEGVGFRTLLAGLTGRMDIILTFLAVLEMAKRGLLAMRRVPLEDVEEGDARSDWHLSLVGDGALGDLAGVDEDLLPLPEA